MRHLVIGAAFRDIVAQRAAEEAEAQALARVNDNDADVVSELGDPLLIALGKLEVAATRVW